MIHVMRADTDLATTIVFTVDKAGDTTLQTALRVALEMSFADQESSDNEDGDKDHDELAAAFTQLWPDLRGKVAF